MALELDEENDLANKGLLIIIVQDCNYFYCHPLEPFIENNGTVIVQWLLCKNGLANKGLLIII